MGYASPNPPYRTGSLAFSSGSTASAVLVERTIRNVPESTTGGAGDKLHPNRTGYLAMGQAIDLDLFKQGRGSRSAKK